ncbi:hypothetical protein WICPIJ_008679 [Wickerhamomyces pijperi]|uniref:Uncharacterized protein n=1 Tax=Wickerhamomyces pijperi TaxID=599730 RepID=A0A9P8PX50_WICPI|nr:hypothetical protein WICPIJ_008679 [Wickerhamomyces pijperi]
MAGNISKGLGLQVTALTSLKSLLYTNLPEAYQILIPLSTLNLGEDGVSWRWRQSLDKVTTGIEERCLSWHETIDDTEFSGRWRPSDIVDWTFLIQGDSGVVRASNTQEIQVVFTVVRLIGAIDISGSQG